MDGVRGGRARGSLRSAWADTARGRRGMEEEEGEGEGEGLPWIHTNELAVESKRAAGLGHPPVFAVRGHGRPVLPRSPPDFESPLVVPTTQHPTPQAAPHRVSSMKLQLVTRGGRSPGPESMDRGGQENAVAARLRQGLTAGAAHEPLASPVGLGASGARYSIRPSRGPASSPGLLGASGQVVRNNPLSLSPATRAFGRLANTSPVTDTSPP